MMKLNLRNSTTLSRRSLLITLFCLTVASTLGGLRVWSRADTRVQDETAPNGRVVCVWYGQGDQKVQVHFGHTSFPEGMRSETRFTEGEHTLLCLSMEQEKGPNPDTVGRLVFTCTGPNIHYTTSVDGREIPVEKLQSAQPVLANAEIHSGAQTWTGKLDVRTLRPATGQKAPGLNQRLPLSVRHKIQPLVEYLVKAHASEEGCRATTALDGPHAPAARGVRLAALDEDYPWWKCKLLQYFWDALCCGAFPEGCEFCGMIGEAIYEGCRES